MELEITTFMWIDVDGIIERGHLSSNSTNKEITSAVNEEVIGMDDSDYFLIGQAQYIQIENEIKKRLGIK